MTDRASFLAAVRATPRGADPGLPERSDAPDAPTELRAGEDPVERFERECDAVGATVEHVGVDAAVDAVLAALEAAGARRVAVAADAPDADDLLAACAGAGLEADAYAAVAPDRARAGRLDATVTGCVAAVAATGSIITSAGTAGRAAALIAPTHVCVVRRSELVSGVHELFDGDRLDAAGSLLAFQSGPSRSADIEKTLILGVHGPGRVHVVLVDGV